MNLSDSKKKLALAGVVCGIVAAVLAAMGNPANMAICIACFVRDTAGALKLHSASAVQYARPEIVGIVVGAFAISAATKEYRSTGGSSPLIRFVLGMIIMIGSLAFLGCPLRQLVLAGQGSSDSAVTVLGLFVGAAVSHNFGLAGAAASAATADKAATAGGVSTAGQGAGIICIVVCFIIALTNRRKMAK